MPRGYSWLHSDGFGQPTITDQPRTQATVPGATFSFQVRATGTAPLAYQWQKNPGKGFSDLAGTTTAPHYNIRRPEPGVPEPKPDMKTFIIFLTLLTAIPISLPCAQPGIPWDGSQADFFSDVDGPFTVGFQFRVESDITVTALGAFDYLGDGFVTPHSVGIWTLAGGAPIATATVPSGAAGSLVGQFRYVSISGISLSANTEYIIGASDFYGTVNDIYAGPVPVPAFSTSSEVTFLGHRGAGEAPGLVFPTVHFDALSPTTFGANFQFVPVPEPPLGVARPWLGSVWLRQRLTPFLQEIERGGMREHRQGARRNRAGGNPNSELCTVPFRPRI